MADPITTKFLLTEADLFGAFRIHRRQATSLVNQFARWSFFALLVLFTLIDLMLLLKPADPERKMKGLNAMIGLTVGGWAVLYAMTWGWRLNLRKRFRALAEGQRSTTWTIDEQGMACRTDLAESKFSWEWIKKIVEGPDGFLVYQLDQLFHFIPGRSFASASLIGQFAVLARSRVPHYILLGECQPPTKTELISLDEL